jgi:tetratricopeptide (TPR) repeat protein
LKKSPLKSIGKSAQKMINAAVQHHTAGRLTVAKGLYEKILQAHPNNYIAAHMLGVISHQLGDNNYAITLISKALSIKPDYAEANFDKGRALAALGRFAEAIQSFKDAVRQKPDYLASYIHLGNVLHMTRRYDEAIECFRKSIDLKPIFPEMHYNIGNAHIEMLRWEEAISSFKESIALKPEYALAHGNLSLAFKRQGNLNEALQSIRRALSFEPNHAQFHNNIGTILKDLGEFEKADEHFRRAISLNPEYAEPYRNLISIVRAKENGPLVTKMEHLFNSQNVSRKDRMLLAFGLGSAYEEMEQYDCSFNILEQANGYARELMTYDGTKDEILFQGIVDAFPHSVFDQFRENSSEDKSPIFVLGMPRSGTTLVEQILASHSHVFGGGETNYLENTIRTVFSRNGLTFPQGFASLSENEISNLAETYIQKLCSHPSPTKRTTDKTTLNFRYLGLIALVFPHARIIHVRRNPLDTCFSIYAKYFPGNQPYAYDLQSLGKFYNLYTTLMKHWTSVVPNAFYEVNYENLVTNTEQEIRGLLDYCDLPFDKNCLSFHKTNRVVQTASAAQVRQPMYDKSIGRWRNFETQLCSLQQMLADA